MNKKRKMDLTKIKKENSSFRMILFVVIVFLLVYFFVYQGLSFVQLRYYNSQLNEELMDVKNQNELLKQDIKKIQTSQYIEETARERLGMVKSDEVPVRILEKEKKESVDSIQVKQEQKFSIYMRDWYEGLKKWFKDAKP